jgi:Arc/MetJ-type ribon-helix-helix transcriptional regulator
MATVIETINLPVTTAAALDSLVAAGLGPSRAAVIADLVAREVEDAARRKAFDEAIAEGEASGYVEMTIEDLRAHLVARHAKPG